MNIVIGSAFRNSTGYLGRYFNQVAALKEHAGPDHTVRVVAIEGDSQDSTAEMLAFYAGVELVHCSHGGPWFGSTEAPERLQALSQVGNAIFNAVRPTDDILVYVESDLVWDPHTIGSLIDLAARREGGFDVFAPLVYAGEVFYDIWGFRKGGRRFSPFKPFHPEVNGHITEIDSAGSCLVMRSEVALSCRIRDDYCLVGWCADARAQGYRIAVCPQFSVRHP